MCKIQEFTQFFRVFLEEWRLYINGYFNLDTDVISRIIFQESGSKLDNIMQLLLSLYLWWTFYHATPPDLKKCLIFCAGKLDLLMFRSSEAKNSKKLREFLDFAHTELEDG